MKRAQRLVLPRTVRQSKGLQGQPAFEPKPCPTSWNKDLKSQIFEPKGFSGSWVSHQPCPFGLEGRISKRPSPDIPFPFKQAPFSPFKTAVPFRRNSERPIVESTMKLICFFLNNRALPFSFPSFSPPLGGEGQNGRACKARFFFSLFHVSCVCCGLQASGSFVEI